MLTALSLNVNVLNFGLVGAAERNLVRVHLGGFDDLLNGTADDDNDPQLNECSDDESLFNPGDDVETDLTEKELEGSDVNIVGERTGIDRDESENEAEENDYVQRERHGQQALRAARHTEEEQSSVEKLNEADDDKNCGDRGTRSIVRFLGLLFSDESEQQKDCRPNECQDGEQASCGFVRDAAAVVRHFP